MAFDGFKNFGFVTLGGTIDAAVTTNLNLGSGNAAKLPTVPFNAVIWNSTDYGTPDLDPNVEILRFTSVTNDTTNTFARAQESTSAATHNTGGKTYKLLATATAKAIKDFPRTGVAGVGTLLSTTTGKVSFLPAAISIPANTIAVGDHLCIEAFWRRRNAGALQNTIQGQISTRVGGVDMPSDWALIATENSLLAVTDIHFASAGVQSYLFRGFRPSGVGTYGADGNLTLDVTTALAVDLLFYWSSAPTDTMSLERYRVTLQKAVSF